MNLLVDIREARNLAPADANGLSDPYAHIQLGTAKSKTSIVYNSLNPVWNQEFTFNVGDVGDDLIITIWDKDQLMDDFLGKVKIPICTVFDAEDRALPLQWYPLDKRRIKSKTPVTGEILLSLCLCKRSESPRASVRSTEFKHQSLRLSEASINSAESSSVKSSSRLSREAEHSVNYANLTDSPIKADQKNRSAEEPSEKSNNLEAVNAQDSITGADTFFDTSTLNYDQPASDKVPDNFPGGILLDKKYGVNMKELNNILFSPGCQFYKDWYSLQKTTNVEELPWRKSEEVILSRVVKYTKAATMMVKATEVTEEQRYLRADKNCYVVNATVSTPDVPYGKCFRVEVLYVMAPVLDRDVGTCLTISFKLRFLESTMMKGMIESKAKQGLEDNFKQFAELLVNFAPTLDNDEESNDFSDVKPKTNWKLDLLYFANVPVLCSVLLLLLVLVHVGLSRRNVAEGLEFWIIDLPDSFQEVAWTSVFVVLMQYLLKRARHFFSARIQQSGDHGVRAVGDGWVLSVVLIECERLASVRGSCTPDPYVVFKCDHKQKKSSVKLQTSKPHWPEYFEFDALKDLPSRIEVEVFHFGGPSAEPILLGHAEVSLLKQSPDDELADMWVPLDGQFAKTFKSRVHIRVSLRTTKKKDVEMEYFAKIEKEAGRKVLRHSPEKNSSFQKLFLLPHYEFLVDDFACALKYKVPIQGRLFLSPRIVGFYSTLFGRKTKLSFVWEDVQDVKHDSLMNNRMGDFFGSTLLLCVKKGRADKFSEYAKKIDTEGRLYFQFQSFVYFKDACRLVMALWKAKSLTPDERMNTILTMTSDAEGPSLQERQQSDVGTFIGLEDAKLTEQCTTYFPVKVEAILMLYESQDLDSHVMEKTGVLNYVATPWNSISTKPSIRQRQLTFTLSLHLSKHSSEITCIQQKTVSEDKRSCKIEEQLTLHGVPLGDSFQLQVRKEFKEMVDDPTSCFCKLYIGVAWRKSSSDQETVTNNLIDEFTRLNKKFLDLAKRDIIKANGKNT